MALEKYRLQARAYEIIMAAASHESMEQIRGRYDDLDPDEVRFVDELIKQFVESLNSI